MISLLNKKSVDIDIEYIHSIFSGTRADSALHGARNMVNLMECASS